MFRATLIVASWFGAIVGAAAADHIFLDGFETPSFRGTNLAGMEMNYANFARIPVRSPITTIRSTTRA